MAEGGRGRGRLFRGNLNGTGSWESPRVCKFYLKGTCFYGEDCRFLHVDNNSEQNYNRTHSQQRIQGERNSRQTSEDGARSSHQIGAGRKRGVEASLAVQRSRGKSCGICYEEVTQKPKGERVFGILSNCNHCFCLACIRKWRQADNFEFDHKITRTCPECRVLSNFFCPSSYWVENKVEKENLLRDYKKSLSEKDCKYFKSGGRCPFGDRCYYKHSRTASSPPPPPPPPPRTEVRAPSHSVRPVRVERRNFDHEIALSQQIEEVEILNSDTQYEEDWFYDTDYRSNYSPREESACNIL